MKFWHVIDPSSSYRMPFKTSFYSNSLIIYNFFSPTPHENRPIFKTSITLQIKLEIFVNSIFSNIINILTLNIYFQIIEKTNQIVTIEPLMLCCPPDSIKITIQIQLNVNVMNNINSPLKLTH